MNNSPGIGYTTIFHPDIRQWLTVNTTIGMDAPKKFAVSRLSHRPAATSQSGVFVGEFVGVFVGVVVFVIVIAGVKVTVWVGVSDGVGVMVGPTILPGEQEVISMDARRMTIISGTFFTAISKMNTRPTVSIRRPGRLCRIRLPVYSALPKTAEALTPVHRPDRFDSRDGRHLAQC